MIRRKFGNVTSDASSTFTLIKHHGLHSHESTCGCGLVDRLGDHTV
jgi:hypothetical protein